MGDLDPKSEAPLGVFIFDSFNSQLSREDRMRITMLLVIGRQLATIDSGEPLPPWDLNDERYQEPMKKITFQKIQVCAPPFIFSSSCSDASI